MIRRLAAIDIGSNASRLLISDVIEIERELIFKEVSFIRVPLRLGESVFIDRKISPQKTSCLEDTVLMFKNHIEKYKVDDYMACATAAMREAKNNQQIVKKILKSTSIELDIISGQEEANIVYSMNIHKNLKFNKTFIYIDVGGGSTQLTLCSQNTVFASYSFPIGALRNLYNQVIKNVWSQIYSWLQANIKENKPEIAIGIGGNINTILEIANKNNGSYFLKYDKIKSIERTFSKADLIPHAALIYLRVMKLLDIKYIYIPKLRLVDGMVFNLYNKRTLFNS